MSDSPQPLLIMRGIVLLIIFGPICLVSGAIAALTLADQVISGWMPSNWFDSGGLLDQMVGGGPGAFTGYVRFMVFAVIASLTGSIIKWGFGR